ncbi:BrxA/BrxB family bacilliredoxin [Candidatus Pacearchaeota archaeon CG10_big_fil_rev_8_21_14_0_10_32_14]|nr:MAG: BrxA/BrxB family bacilliredoxin [Candidatus Pacearchaeota archaeon CG10_big_fil_rev_8_21_14_0_10_32_14]
MHVNRYDPKLTKFMEEALVKKGFNSLKSSQDVEKYFKENKDFLLFVNSVCGCAAGSARPGVLRAIEKNGDLKKMKMATVFAGVDLEATEKARSYFSNHEKSSPNIILFKNKKPVLFMERKDIVHKDAGEIAEILIDEISKFKSLV